MWTLERSGLETKISEEGEDENDQVRNEGRRADRTFDAADVSDLLPKLTRGHMSKSACASVVSPIPISRIVQPEVYMLHRASSANAPTEFDSNGGSSWFARSRIAPSTTNLYRSWSDDDTNGSGGRKEKKGRREEREKEAC